jgi:hypothetical protein
VTWRRTVTSKSRDLVRPHLVRILKVAVLLLCGAVSASAAPITIFTDTFDAGSPDFTLGGVTAVYSGDGRATEDNQNLDGSAVPFSGNILRNDNGGNPQSPATVLTLTGLGAHTSVSLGFLLGILDSWDAVGCCSPDSFNVQIGSGGPMTSIFSELFDNCNGGAGQTFGGASRGVWFNGSGGCFADAAYDLSNFSPLLNIAHTSSTLVVSFFASGPGWQGGGDESWGIDNLNISMDAVEMATVPEPATLSMLGASLVGVAALARRRKNAANVRS